MARNRYTNEAGVLNNKLGIVDRQQLIELEYALAIHRARSLSPQSGRPYDLNRLRSVHEHLFGDLYEWAGKVRTVPIERYSPLSRTVTVFAAPEKIVDDWRILEGQIHQLLGNHREDFARDLASLTDIYVEANRIHPFPEGNGRSLQVFMRCLAQERRIDLDFAKTNADEWNHASALSATHGRLFERTHFIAMPSDSGPIRIVFENIAAAIAPAVDRAETQPFVVSSNSLARLADKDSGQHDALAIVERTARSRGYNDDEVARVVASARIAIAERAKAALLPTIQITDPTAKPTVTSSTPAQTPDVPKPRR